MNKSQAIFNYFNKKLTDEVIAKIAAGTTTPTTKNVSTSTTAVPTATTTPTVSTPSTTYTDPYTNYKNLYLNDPSNRAALQEQKNVINAAYDASDQLIKENYEAGVSDARESYLEQLDTNAVQKAITERQIAESMANAGITNSGMNASQMTASELSYANAQSKVRLQQQAAIDTLAKAMRESLLSNELSRKSEIQSLETAQNDAANAYANEQITLANEEAEKSQTKFETNKKAARTDLLSVLADDTVDETVKRSAFSDYLANYGIDATDVALKPYESKYNVKTTVDPETGAVTSKASYTEDDVVKYTRLWQSRNVSDDDFFKKAEEAMKHLSDEDYAEFLNAVTGGKSRDNLGVLDPTTDTEGYTVIDKGDPDGEDFKGKWGVDNDEWGDLVLDAVVEDEFGIRRTISDIFHNARLYYIRQEHKNDWATWSKKGTNLEDALRDEGSDAWEKALEAVEQFQIDVGITED